MNTALDQLKTTVASLPVHERVELADFLLTTLDPYDQDASAEWLAIAEDRMAEIRSGNVVGIPAEQVLESLRRPRP